MMEQRDVGVHGGTALTPANEAEVRTRLGESDDSSLECSFCTRSGVPLFVHRVGVDEHLLVRRHVAVSAMQRTEPGLLCQTCSEAGFADKIRSDNLRTAEQDNVFRVVSFVLESIRRAVSAPDVTDGREYLPCGFCHASGVPTRSYEDTTLCGICASTPGGNAARYPEQYPERAAMRSYAARGNEILARLGNIGRAR
jgi:hypothetical protein